MSKRIARTVLRMNLEKEADCRAWAHLQHLDRKRNVSSLPLRKTGSIKIMLY